MKHLLFAAAITIITVLACQKEVSLTNVPTVPTTNTTVTATVVGRVVDENGAPVQGALIKAGTGTVQTNLNGEFRLNNATLSERTAFVMAEKNGYFTGSRTFIAKAGQKHYVEIQLLPKSTAGSIDATTGGTVTLANGSTLTLPANAVVTKSTGIAYTGTVQVAITWINPTSNNMLRQMPGDLRGIDEAGTEMGLRSFGMLAAELSSPSGEALQVAPGKKASLKFPLPSTISGTAPATIALWSFNDTTGLWKQEGTATKSGNFYMADVSHFSYWNCDAPGPLVSFTAKFVDQNGSPLQFAHVIIRRTSANIYGGSGFTDSAGNVSGWIPSNETVLLEVYVGYSCNQTIFTQNIGPFSAATNLGTITVTLSANTSFTVTGSVVNCNNTAVTAGYVAVNTGLSIYYAPIINGAFSLSFTSCSSSQPSVTYYAVDSTNSVQSTPTTTTLTGSTTSVGTITACGLSSQRYINFTLDGIAYTITSPPDSTTGWLSQSMTLVSGYKGGTATTYTALSTRFNGSAIGSFPINSISVRTPTFSDSLVTPVGTINVNVTEYGAVGAFISGSFSGSINGTNNTPHTIQCSFRVRRD